MSELSRKPRIGIIVGNYHSDHARRLVKNLYELAAQENISAHIFLGTESSSFLTEFSLASNHFDYQYASLYSISKYSELDLLIISVGTLSIFQSAISPEQFIESLPDIPMVLTETRIMPKRGAYIITDNYGGIKSIVEHLINVHNLKKIAYLGGPKTGNIDAAERLQAYLDTMNEKGLPCGQNLVRYGDYSEHVDHLAEELLSLNPGLEAIVCANDEMAIAAYRACWKRGMTVGHDIAVTGFDDMEMATIMTPPLTTVKQDYEDMSKKAMEMALAILRGEEVKPEIIPAPFIRRSSCCCPTTNPKLLDTIFRYKERGNLIKNMWRMHDQTQHSWVGALITRELLLENSSKQDFFNRLGNSLRMVGTKSSVIALFETPRIIREGEIPEPPEYMKLYLHQHVDYWEAYNDEDAPKYYLKEKNIQNPTPFYEGTRTIFLLFYEELQYGIMGVEIKPEDIEFYYTLSMEIGTALRYLTLSLAQQQYQSELKSVARHDSLTDLYNRLGFMEAAEDFVVRHKDETMVTMMADLDHLKQINDNFGHVEGDFAIRKCADYLREAIGNKGFLGRNGGDEFLGIFTVKDEAEMSAVVDNIKKISEDFNAISDKPYYVDVSVGCTSFRMDNYTGFSELISKADELLYEKKKVRKTSVIR